MSRPILQPTRTQLHDPQCFGGSYPRRGWAKVAIFVIMLAVISGLVYFQMSIPKAIVSCCAIASGLRWFPGKVGL